MLNERHQRGLEMRGLDLELAIRLGTFSGRRCDAGETAIDAAGSVIKAKGGELVPDLDGEFLCFPYFEGERLVQVKGRSRRDGEKFFIQQPNCEKTFYNANVLLNDDFMADMTPKTGPMSLCITEGEPDCQAALMAGYYTTVSVPNGAPPARDKHGRLIEVPRDTSDIEDLAQDVAFSYLWRFQEQLKAISHFVIATDDDEAGRRLAKELVRRLGAARCSLLQYPKDPVVVDRKTGEIRPVKDLDEVRQHFGLERVEDLIRSAKAVPVEGLFQISDYPDPGELEILPCHITPEFDAHLKLYPSAFMPVTGLPNLGKALALDTLIPTPSGWTTMREIKVGDEVFDETGKPCHVVAATEVMMDRPCYRMRFDNDQEIVADANHQWFTSTNKARMSMRNPKHRLDGQAPKPKGTDQSHKRSYPSVTTTEEISRTLRANGKGNHQVALSGSLTCDEVELEVAPYTLGAWLGDGRTDFGSITAFDEAVLAGIAAEGYTVRAQAQAGQYGILKLGAQLRAIGVLGDKHIPAKYQRASTAQRLSLLQGLMDTDGYCSADRYCEFVSMNPRLAHDVLDLLGGLGIKASMREGLATLHGRTIGTKYRITFAAETPVFTIPRKLSRQQTDKPLKSPNHRIVAADLIDSVPVRCIQVDSPSHLFLVTRSFIPTHNSEIVKQIAVNMGIHYGWHTAIFPGEEMIKPFLDESLKTKFLRKPKKLWTPQENETADEFVHRHFSIIGADPRFEDDYELTVEKVLDLAATSVFRFGTKLLVIDPWNELDHERDSRISLTEYVGKMIRKMKKFAKYYGCVVIVVAHPKKVEGQPNLYDISDSAHWFNKADLSIIIDTEDQLGTLRDAVIPKIRFNGVTGKKGIVPLDFDMDTRMFVRPADLQRAAA